MKGAKSNYICRERIGLQFPYDKEMVKSIKHIKDATWDDTLKNILEHYIYNYNAVYNCDEVKISSAEFG
jgi:hypothetical protein